MFKLSTYIIFFVFSSLVASLATVARVRQQTTLALIVLIPLIFFLGFRGNISSDYISYIDIYNQVPVLGNFSVAAINNVYGEYGFLFSVSILKTIFNMSEFVFIAIALISLFTKFSFIKFFSENFLFILILYFSFYLILYEVIQIRWGLALGIGLYSLVYLYKDKYLTYLFFSVLAATMHLYAVVFIFFPFFARALSLRALSVIFLFSVFVGFYFNIVEIFVEFIVYLSPNSYVSGKIVNYYESARPISNVFLFKVFFINLFFIFGYFKNNKPVVEYVKVDKNLFIFKMSLFFTSYIFLVSDFGILAGRILPVVDLITFILIINFFSRTFSAMSFYLLSVITIFCSIFVFWYVSSQSYADGNLWDYVFTSFGEK